MERKIPPGWIILQEKMKKRIAKANEIKKRGGNKFEQLEARLMDEETGKLGEDMVIYALRTIKKKSEAESFLKGYCKHVRKNKPKYSGKGDAYVKDDIITALYMHFTVKETYDLWKGVVENYKKKN
ncbi:hypothetical protein HOD29_06880 [archaeon]|jgi:hypothetical protein|nr:hypothetical protein [archaeon]